MSVINKMLKDLDKRQQPHGIESMAKPQNAVIAPRQSKLPLLFASSLSLVVGGLIVYLMIETRPLETSPLETEPLELAAQTNITATKNSVQVEPESLEAEIESSTAAEPAAAKSQQQPKAASLAADKAVATVNSTAKTSAPQPAVAEKQLIASAGVEVKRSSESTVEHLAAVVAVKEHHADVESQTPVKSASSMSIEPAKQRSKDRYNGSKMAVKEVKLTGQQLAQKQMVLANDAQQQGLHSDALTYYKAALSYNPALHQARRQAAALYYGQNKLSESAQLLKQGILLFPQQYEYALLLARVQQSAGQNQQALNSLALIPDSSSLALKKWHQQSDLAQKQQNYPVAEQSFRQLAKKEPTQGRWWMGLGYALDAQKNYSEAKSAYNQALAQGNLSSQAQAYVDNRLVQLGAY